MTKRTFLYSLIFLISSLSCKQKETTQDLANQTINESIKISGGEKINNSTIAFQFRDKNYKATRNNGLFVLERSIEDSIGLVKDELSNSGFKRFINDELQNLPDSIADNYGNSVNSVHYFSVLPYGLNDPAVYKDHLGSATINEKEYSKIKVTFDEIGGGKDFDDVFIYWIGKEDYKVDYLAYSFHDNGGGMRFRKAYNERYIKGIRFVDYENYEPKEKEAKLIELDRLFQENKLELLSKIELKNVKVE